jgi:hypothetical protein
MDTTNLSELEDLIRKSLDDFYTRRINKLSQLKLKKRSPQEESLPLSCSRY